MKLSITILSILAASTSAAETPCSESAGVCVCSGSCPSFVTGDWSKVDGMGYCVAAANDGIANTSQDGDSVTATVGDVTYTSPFTACPGEGGGGDTSTSSGAGLISVGYYAGVVTAFVGML